MSEASDASAAFVERLRRHVGESAPPEVARDPVNAAMIRHWCDAMDDANPVYLDPAFAAKSVHGELVAPPAMLNAWTMPGLAPRNSEGDPLAAVLAALDDAGFTSVVATNSTHAYERYARVGETLAGTLTLTEVSDEKTTALGVGHFVTTETEFKNQRGELLGSERFRILKFRPGTGRVPSDAPSEPAPKALRPRPGISHDTRFFWDGLREGELRIQECRGCGALYHPPLVRCAGCGSYDLGYRVSSGRGHVYSFVEPVYPPIPGFDYPYVVGLIALEEGTRLVANVTDLDVDRVAIGMPVQCVIRELDPDLSLPMFQPRRPPRSESTLSASDVSPGQQLDPCPIAVTATGIVAGAIASRDYQDVHHDRDLAKRRGAPDIFMNILTTNGLCARYLSDWAGPDAILKSLDIRLGVPNYPGDTMTLYATVDEVGVGRGRHTAALTLRGTNRLGDHVTGRAELELAGGAS